MTNATKTKPRHGSIEYHLDNARTRVQIQDRPSNYPITEATKFCNEEDLAHAARLVYTQRAADRAELKRQNAADRKQNLEIAAARSVSGGRS